jgi:hypothetical protein
VFCFSCTLTCKRGNNTYLNCSEASRKSRRRADQQRPLRTEVEIAAALDEIAGDEEELLSVAGSLDEFSRWIEGDVPGKFGLKLKI